MKLLTGLFRACRKALLTTDNDMGAFRQKLTELVEKKDTLSDEEVTAKVEELKKITDDLPDDDGKAELLRYLEDFKTIKEQDANVAKKAAEVVAGQFEKLDTAAMKGIPAETPAEPAPEEVKVEETTAPDATGDEDGAKEEVKETVEKTDETKDDDPNAEYSLEEIYQFIKKRMAEDTGAETEEPVADGCEEKTEEKDEVVTDCAPKIAVTVNDGAAGGDLRALFEMAKRGK